jgi:Protein of unknown function (DUF1566)
MPKVGNLNIFVSLCLSVTLLPLSASFSIAQAETRVVVIPLMKNIIHCDGNPYGGLIDDACGVCGGDGTSCAGCDNIPNSGLVIDKCGVCGGLGDCDQDCNGDWNGSAYYDNCNTCVGGKTGSGACTLDCNNEWGGTAVLDNCEVCIGGSTGLVACTQDCNDEWGGDAELDECGVCEGDGSSCAFIDNGDSTITNVEHNLLWQKLGSTVDLNYEGASAYCETLDQAGLTNWRVPTRNELNRLIYCDNSGPTIPVSYSNTCDYDYRYSPPIYYGPFTSPPIQPVFSCYEDRYWHANSGVTHGYVDFVTGKALNIVNNPELNFLKIRCVSDL